MKARFLAFLVHLGVSCIVGLFALALVFKIWYPSPLHVAVGVNEVFVLLLGVDVVIGPCLTLIVFDATKKSLRFDLVVICLLQVLAFLYGLWILSEGRPAWIVYNADRFDLVQVYQIDSRVSGQVGGQYRSPSFLGPLWVSAKMPENNEERNVITFESVFSGVDMAQRPNLYRPLIEAKQQMHLHQRSINELYRYNSSELVQRVISEWPEANGFLPMMARIKPMTVLLDKNARVVAVVDLRPWD